LKFLGFMVLCVGCTILLSVVTPTVGKVAIAILLLMAGIGIIWDDTGSNGPGGAAA
jgi:hypothetical protein